MTNSHTVIKSIYRRLIYLLPRSDNLLLVTIRNAPSTTVRHVKIAMNKANFDLQ